MFYGQSDHFDHDHMHNTILSSNAHGQMVKTNRYFNKFQKFQQQKIWNCRDFHDLIWINHFDHENFGDDHGQNCPDHLTIETQF
jgi:hypothetical protein